MTNSNGPFSGRFQSFRRKTKFELVFGNNLENVPLYLKSSDSKTNFYTDKTSDVPEFVVRCVERIETMISAVGIYRINGDALVVGRIR